MPQNAHNVNAIFFSFFIVSEIKDMQTPIPQVFYCRKSTGLFSSASVYIR